MPPARGRRLSTSTRLILRLAFFLIGSEQSLVILHDYHVACASSLPVLTVSPESAQPQIASLEDNKYSNRPTT